MVSIMDGTTDRITTLLRDTSRTFALSIEGLPAGLREEIAVSYLLLRVSDYIEDHDSLPAEEKIRLLGTWEATLERPERVAEFLETLSGVPHRPDDPEADVVLGCGTLLEELESFPDEQAHVIVERVRETTRGMARWQAKGPRVENEQELDDYMHQVAGLVGYLVTDLFAIHYPAVRRRHLELMPLAREFGLALQTVNVLRGLRKDYERGWVFVPQTFVAAHGLIASDLFRASEQRRAMAVVGDLIGKAERHIQFGLAYVRLIPRRLHQLRLACIWPLLFAAKTIAISRENPAVLNGEVKISRATVKQIVRDTTVCGWSNAWIQRYANRLLTADQTV